MSQPIVGSAASLPSLEEAIHRAVQEYVAAAVVKAMEDAKRDLTQKIPQITAEVGIAVQSFLEANRNGAVIQIRMEPRLW